MQLPSVNVNVTEEVLSGINVEVPFLPAVLLKTKSGPVGEITAITSEQNFKNIFGNSDYTVPNAYALQLYLKAFKYVYVTRIASSSAAKGTATVTFDNSGSDVQLFKVETKYKTDTLNGKTVKLVYDGTAHKVWLDVSSITGRNTISIKEDCVVDTLTAAVYEDGVLTGGLEFILNKLVNSKFTRIDHEEVIKILKEAPIKWEFQPEYGEDIAREHEKYITEYFNC